MTVKSKKIFDEMVNHFKVEPGRNKDFQLVDNCPFDEVVQAGATRELVFDFESDYGTVICLYDPSKAIEILVTLCEEYIDEPGIVFQNPDGNGVTLSIGQSAGETRKSIVERLSTATTIVLLHCVRSALERSLANVTAEAFLLTVNRMTFHIEDGLKELEWVIDVESDTEAIKARLDNLLRDSANMHREFIKDTLTRLRQPDFSSLKDYRARLLPVWKGAKTIYTQNKQRPSWKKIVKETFPAENLPDDLIDRLSKKGESAPGDIALEHAARVCGAKANEHSRAFLYERLNDEGETLPHDDLTH